MQWLLDLITKHTKEGVLDTDAFTKEVNTEFPKHAVPKADFNTLNEQLKTANGTIADLKKNNADNEALQATIKTHEGTIQQLKDDMANTSKTHDLKEKLSKSGVLDPDYMIYKHGGVDKFTFDKEGKAIGVDDTIKSYKEDKALAHLFKAADGTNYTPADGGNYTGKNPFAKESFNLTEQGKLLRDNPAQAKSMASAAGITI